MSFTVVRDPIDAAAIERAVRTDSCGAVATFAGIVRRCSDDGLPVTGLSYQAHEAMAIDEFERIAAEARERFGPCEISIAHRIGDLRVGETAVVVAVAAPHRANAFDACRYAIDELKRRAPIWKREHYAHGASVWKSNACDDAVPS